MIGHQSTARDARARKVCEDISNAISDKTCKLHLENKSHAQIPMVSDHQPRPSPSIFASYASQLGHHIPCKPQAHPKEQHHSVFTGIARRRLTVATVAFGLRASASRTRIRYVLTGTAFRFLTVLTASLFLTVLTLFRFLTVLVG